MSDNPFKKYARQEVVINAAGMTYRGVLIEANETEVLLQSDTGWISVNMDRIVSVRGADEDDDGLRSNSFVDHSFYDFDPSE